MRAELQPRSARDRMIVALDVSGAAEALALVTALGDSASFYKIGMQLVFAGGLPLIAELLAAEKRVFLDMKLLDIENTVAGAVGSIAKLGVTFTTIHAYPKAMRAAVSTRPADGPGLLAVTVLTSMDNADLRRAGYADEAAVIVAARAKDAHESGMDGIVCWPQDAAAVRRIVGAKMAIVTPGIRPAGASAGDQKRTMTPTEAIAAGADYLVVGRPITAAPDPAAAAEAIVAEIETALAYIAAHADVWEVIVSGGDPLVLSPRRLASLSAKLGAIPHVKVLRWRGENPPIHASPSASSSTLPAWSLRMPLAS